jgi:DNA-directed RNA polymerase subunit RPC12/RpoP
MSEPQQRETVTTKAPPTGRKFPCSACGARLDFDPKSQALQCPYCGHKEVIQPSAGAVQERNWDEYWSTQAGEETSLAGRATQVTCTGCGAVVLFDDKVVTDKCPYCATHLENQPETAKAMIPPGGALPFKVSHRDAVNAFNDWIGKRWFAPSGLKKLANLGQLTGSYMPHWTFDSMTYTWYTGERGDDYTETEHYTETETSTDADGNTTSREVPKTRSVTKTIWTPVSGNVNHFFDDVLVQASQSVPPDLARHLTPWDLEHLEEYKSEFLSGFLTERYTIGLREGFDTAREIMDGEIRQMCCQDIGGNHQRLHSVNTQHVGVTFKHILLPLWVASYRYQDKPYQVLVNGRTGKVTGNRPYSWIKITLFVLFIAAVIAGLIWLFSGQRSAPHPRAEVEATPALRVAFLDRSPVFGASASREPATSLKMGREAFYRRKSAYF